MQTVIEILIDYSSSMEGDKIDICKMLLLEDVLPMIDYSSRIGIKTFTASTAGVPSILERQALKITNKEELTNAITNLNAPSGNTPIAAAIKNSVTSLKEYRAFNKKIILITDGEENCQGDYEAEAKNAKIEGIECEIHIVGLGLNENAVGKAKRITSITGGTFSDLRTSNYSTYKSGAAKTAISGLTNAIGKSTPIPTSISENTRNINPPAEPFDNTIPEVQASIDSIPNSPEEESLDVNVGTENLGEKLVDSVQEKNTSEGQVGGFPQENANYTQLASIVENNSKILKGIEELLTVLREEIEELKATGLKINYEDEGDQEVVIIENGELNEQVRIESEKYVFESLKFKYGDRVKWLNEQGESGKDHDFEVVDVDDSIEYYIECKGTKSLNRSFLITKNEWRLFLNQTKNYQVIFVFDALNEPKIIKIDNLLDWILKGKVVPYPLKNIKLKSERVVLTILE